MVSVIFVELKKVIPILFLSMYLVSTTELYQLVKLPFLVEHFNEFQKENSESSLWGFLCMHYVSGDKNDADNDKDMKLPFKSHESCSSSNIVAFASNVFSIAIDKPFINETTTFPLFDESFIGASFQSTIWQPPKFC